MNRHDFYISSSQWQRRVLLSAALCLLSLVTLVAQTPATPVVRIGGNVYGGGNRGNLELETNVEVKSGEIVGAVYGGARMANVLATNVTINGGIVNDVYGGNDITGNVVQETNVDIRASVVGNIYGGGNGSYLYTDNAELKDDPQYADFYYEPGTNSAEALNNFRPNVPKTTVHLCGAGPDDITYIGGSVYCGGNSATLRPAAGDVSGDAEATMKIGSYVVANNVFIGSNGENMVTPEMLEAYADPHINTLDLTDSATFATYMEGVDVSIRPSILFDEDDPDTPENEGYVSYSTRIGSFFCGGNVGSMSAPGTFIFNFIHDLVIFDKLVGGCNNANVPAGPYNAVHRGGIIGTLSNGVTTKVQLNLSGVKLEPRILTYDDATDTFTFTWHIDKDGLLNGGNVYGGCFRSGHINGGTEVNILENTVSELVFDPVEGCGVSEATLREDAMTTTMSVYGGGYGVDSEIWGDVHMNVLNNGRALMVYGGGERGVVGKTAFGGEPAVPYNTIVTLNAKSSDPNYINTPCIYGGGFRGTVLGNTTLYLNNGTLNWGFAGACDADILGGAEVFIGLNGRPLVLHGVFGGNDFGGQIRGTLEHNVAGRAGVPIPTSVTGIPQTVRSNTYVEYYSGNITEGEIYGGPFGDYDYDDAYYYEDAEKTIPRFDSKPTLMGTVDRGSSDKGVNTFVNILSPSTLATDRVINIYGGGQGTPGMQQQADVRDTYVLVHAATVSNRSVLLADRVFGAGNCSKTNTSLVDFYTGNVQETFGGCAGSSGNYFYAGDNSTVNLYPTADKEAMDIFGAGA